MATPAETNQRLRAELAELQAVARSLGMDASAPSASSSAPQGGVRDLNLVRDVFADFDARGDGTVDAAEIVALAASLGELLDADEAADALAALDADGEGRVSFAAFTRWWTDEQRVLSLKSPAALRVLRARLIAGFVGQGVPHLLQRLAERRPEEHDAGDAAEWVDHRWRVAVGEAAAGGAAELPPDAAHPGSHVTLRATFLEPAAAREAAAAAGCGDFDGCGLVATFRLLPPEGAPQDEAARAEAAGALVALLRAKHEHVRAEPCPGGGGATLLRVGVPAPDPTAAAAELGVNLAEYVDELTLTAELREPVSRLLDAASGDEGALASAVSGSASLRARFRKALVYAAMPMLGNSHEAAAALSLTFLHGSSLAVAFGDLESFCEHVRPAASSGEEEAARAALRAQADALRESGALDEQALAALAEQQRIALERELEKSRGPSFLQPEFWLQTGFQDGLARSWRDAVAAALAGDKNEDAGALLAALRSGFSALASAELRSPSGLLLTATLHRWLDFSLLPHMERDATTGRWVVRG